MFAFMGLLDLVLGEGEGRKGMLLPLFACVVVGDRIREQTAIAPYIYPMMLLDQGDEYILPHSPSRSLWFLCENGGLRRDRMTGEQYAGRLNS